MSVQFFTTNRLLNLGVCAWLLAQMIKAMLFCLQNKKINLHCLIGAGGMPSAHSALGCSVAVGAVQEFGWDSPYFALALTFALVIMYDAMGVRYAAGKQARAINLIVSRLDESISTDDPSLRQSIGTLQESLGHRPAEVVCGAALGTGVAVISTFFFKN